jgi:hypothetical protein
MTPSPLSAIMIFRTLHPDSLLILTSIVQADGVYTIMGEFRPIARLADYPAENSFALPLIVPLPLH